MMRSQHTTRQIALLGSVFALGLLLAANEAEASPYTALNIGSCAADHGDEWRGGLSCAPLSEFLPGYSFASSVGTMKLIPVLRFSASRLFELQGREMLSTGLHAHERIGLTPDFVTLHTDGELAGAAFVLSGRF